ncbi:helix-turn-helix domain-containing protein [Pedobacter helvus]|uniref:Helix-turn-helix domain-containing protein n=1 Tax=Pedobacter helvus TaxID=2563444 RepID=A0ABW9JJ29_9SPHI|nr:helix-turn-helix domain-containing protein [Pedobacter ureilyticus]
MMELASIKSQLVNSHHVPNVNEPIYLKIDKAAEFLSMTKNALNLLVFKKKIPYLKKLGKIYFLKSELVNWLESGREHNEEIHPEDFLVSNKKLKSNKAA